MITEIKERLIENPEYIRNILEHYEFYHIDVRSHEIRCGIGEDTNKTSVRIKLKNNDYLYVTDYGRGINCDLINFIIQTRHVDFVDVINVIKKEIGLDNFYYTKKYSVFGGFYDKIKRRQSNDIEMQTYDKEILDRYTKAYNVRFLKDNINAEAQKFFNVMYDIESQRIVFPIYDWEGRIIGVKGRANWTIQDDEPKYLYLVPCFARYTLYGYSHNYVYLQNNRIIIVEAEKGVMQAFTYGYRNVVALGCNSISPNQCKLLMSLNPKEIVFALDEGLDKKVMLKNMQTLQTFTKMSDIKINYWDAGNSKYVANESHKSSTDMGKGIFERILAEEIKDGGKLLEAELENCQTTCAV